MRNLLQCSAVLLLSIPLLAQTDKPPAAPAPASNSTAHTGDAVLSPGAGNGVLTKELAEAYFKRAFGYDPNLQVHVASVAASAAPELYEVVAVFSTPEGQQVIRWYVTKDLKHTIAGDLRPFGADPYQGDREELAKSAFGATKGPADAKLLIVEFADLECPSCREAQPIMEKLYAEYPNARFIFQSFPLVTLHPWAFRAAAYMDCISRSNQEQAFSFAQAVYGHQKEIESIVRRTGDDGKPKVDDAEVTGRLRHYTETSGADPANIQACAELPDTTARINRSFALGQSIGVTGTPTIYVNGRLLGNPGAVSYEALKAVINFEAEQAK
jgi:protein-disulfide isomerase